MSEVYVVTCSLHDVTATFLCAVGRKYVVCFSIHSHGKANHVFPMSGIRKFKPSINPLYLNHSICAHYFPVCSLIVPFHCKRTFLGYPLPRPPPHNLVSLNPLSPCLLCCAQTRDMFTRENYVGSECNSISSCSKVSALFSFAYVTA